jgi:hypothetical protein
MRARQLIFESLLKEATEEEKLVAQALDSAFDQLEASIKANKEELAPELQNEAVGFAIAGSVVSMPALLKLVGKAVAKVQSKLKGEKVETNTIIKIADKLHHLLIGGVEKALQVVFRIKDKKQAHRLAVILFHAIVAGLLIASGKALFKALQKHNTIMSLLEGLLSAIKSGELGVFLTETFGEIATALGLGAELSDAANLADAIDVSDLKGMVEVSVMATGAVEGGAGKPEENLEENLEENKMNKLKITKGRLRQILAEEVARHKKQKLNEMTMAERGMVDAMAGNPPSKIGQGNKEYMEQYNDILVFTGREPLPMKQPDQAYLDALRSGRLEEMGAKEEEAEAASFAAQAKGAAATKAGAEGADAFYEGEELEEADGLDKEAMLRKIVDEKQADKIEGTMVDLFSASAIVSVLDAINPANKERFLKLPVGSMASLAFKMLKEEKTDMLEESADDYEGIIEGDFVNIIGGALTGAVGRVVELTKTINGNPALVVRLTKDADRALYGKATDEVIVQPKFVEKDQGMYSKAAMEEGMHTGDPKAPPMSAAVFIDMIATKLGMSKEEVAKKMAMAMVDIQAAEDSAKRAGMSPSAGERERFDRATMEEDKHAGMTTAKFADMFDLNMQQDNDGQTIFYASSEPGPKLKELIRQANAAGYSMENNNDGSITIYTGEHSSGDRYSDEFETFADMKYAMAQRDKMEEEKTDKHDDKMKEKGFSDEQAENLPDQLQKAMLKKEVRAMLEELMSDV